VGSEGDSIQLWPTRVAGLVEAKCYASPILWAGNGESRAHPEVLTLLGSNDDRTDEAPVVRLPLPNRRKLITTRVLWPGHEAHRDFGPSRADDGAWPLWDRRKQTFASLINPKSSQPDLVIGALDDKRSLISPKGSQLVPYQTAFACLGR
jgi:hypothetical protein